MKIKKITKINEDKVFDLEIEDNHNFFSNGILVHNCNYVRGLMKKLGKADKKPEDLKKWEECVNRFMEGAIKNGITKAEANKVADDLLQLSAYSFNKCFSGDTIMDKDSWSRAHPLTIKEMFLIKNDKEYAKKTGHLSLHWKYRKDFGKCYSLNDDGRLRLNKIVDIYYQGKRKTFKITLDDGKTIKVTSNHKFPMKNGENKTLENGLTIGDSLIINGGYEGYKKLNGKYNFSKTKQKEIKYKTYEGCGFKKGEENSAYINGEYIKFVYNKNILLDETKNKCQKCGKEAKRLECHHINGNRLDNDLSNLIICCSSCHKKMDYSLNRKRKGGKGNTTGLARIVSIEEQDEEDVFNVEMEAPYHTLSVNNIVASNSHAVAYTYTALMTLYLSYYFRKYFYSAVLTYEVDRKDYLFDRLQSVKSHGIQVLQPDINRSNHHFSPVGDDIIFGLSNIKMVGEESAKIIIEKRPYSSFSDFVLKTKGKEVNKRVVIALVSAGAFDQLEPNRKKMIYIAENYYERKASIKVEEKLTNLIETITREANALNLQTKEEDLIALEKEFFDFNFFYNVFPSELIEKLNLAKSKGLVETNIEEVYSSIKVPVVVKKIKLHTDKNGKEMAFIDAEDMFYHSVSTPIFQGLWKEVKERLTEGKIHLINFYRNKKEDGTEQIMFGKSGYLENKEEIRRMVKPLVQS